MQYNVSSVQEYLDAVQADPKYAKFMEIREYLRSEYPEFEESVEYGMLRFGTSDDAVFYLQVQRQHIGLYVGDIAKIDPDGGTLRGVNHGKGCIRLRKTSDLEKSGIFLFIDKTIELWKNGEDISC